MKIRVFDTEGVGLNSSATKLWNLCYTEDGKEFHYTTDYNTMREWLQEFDVLWVGHYAIGHDLPAIKAVLGLEMTYKQFWDTMYCSWALFPDRPKHGLEALGLEHGFPKVVVSEDQWEEGDPVLMRERVEQDVLINYKEWDKQSKRLCEIYGTSEVDEEILRYVRYLSFKGDCLREQQENPLKINREKAQKHFEELEAVVQEKLVELIAAMPKVPVEHTAPKIYKKKDGTLSAHGVRWEANLREHGQPSGTTRFFEYINGNPNGPQLKEYLFSLGWEPCTYKFVRDKLTGDERQIPQVRYFSANDPRKGELTDSVKSLIEQEPSLEALDGLTMSQHRMNIFKAFLENSDENGICVAGAGGFTNTLRFKHRNPFVNLPKADGEVPWGVEIRSCIVAPEGYEMCGSDVVSLEASTKRHYMYPHDPEYADAMGAEGFDEHLNLAEYAGAVTGDEERFYHWFKNQM